MELFHRMEKAEARLELALQSNMWSLFNKFSQKVELWTRVTRVVQQLDCILSLAHLSLHASDVMSRPTFVSNGDGVSEKPVLRFRKGRHPCVAKSLDDESDFIPNNLVLGGKVRIHMCLCHRTRL